MLVDVAEHVDGRAADRRQEHLEVAARDELGEHARRVLEQRAAQDRFGAPEARGDAGQIPDRFDRGLHDDDGAACPQDLARRSGARPASTASASSGHVDVRAGDGDRRANVVALLEVRRGTRRSRPRRTDRATRSSSGRTTGGYGPMAFVGDVLVRSGFCERIERAGGDRDRAVHRVRSGVRADHVALRLVRDRADERPARPSGPRRPTRSARASGPCPPGWEVRTMRLGLLLLGYQRRHDIQLASGEAAHVW